VFVIRGAIEVATPALVSGWIYCKLASLRDQLVLAFVDGRCVGSGRVEIYRKDLAEAKLGDGYCGFHFPIVLQEGEQAPSIVIRLQDSDASLLQARSRVV
jgi:hypothetical protein